MLDYHANTAIPARNISLSGHCPVLSSMFDWTAPISMSALLKQQKKRDVGRQPKSGEFYERYERYRQSDFGQIEKAFESIPFHKEPKPGIGSDLKVIPKHSA